MATVGSKFLDLFRSACKSTLDSEGKNCPEFFKVYMGKYGTFHLLFHML